MIPDLWPFNVTLQSPEQIVIKLIYPVGKDVLIAQKVLVKKQKIFQSMNIKLLMHRNTVAAL